MPMRWRDVGGKIARQLFGVADFGGADWGAIQTPPASPDVELYGPYEQNHSD